MFRKKTLKGFIIILLIFLSTTSLASDGLEITSWIVDSTLLENGNLEVLEDLTFDFQNEFNGVFRNIVLQGTDGVSNLEVFEIINGEEIPYDFNPDGKKGDKDIFKSEIKGNNMEIMIFSPSRDEEKTFRFKYHIQDLATRHIDTGELYYKFLGEENDTYIDYFSALIHLPSIDIDDMKIFAHGPSNGEIFFTEDKKVKLEVRNVRSNNFIEARVLFPRDFLSVNVKSNNNTLDNILDEELSFAQELEKQAENRLKLKEILSNISIIVTGAGALIIGFIFNRLRRDTDIYDQLNSLSPKDITPAELRLFISGVSDSRSLMATIFDLARKEYILIDEDTNGKKKGSNFLLTQNSRPGSDLLSHEIYLLGWLFSNIGSGESLSTKDIERYRKKSSMKFHKEFSSWQSKVKSNLYDRNYYDESTKGLGLVLLIISFISFILAIGTFVNDSLYGLAPLLLAFASFPYGLSLFFRKSDLGYIENQMWKDYKKDLERQGKTPENYEDIIPEDKDLIYGLALGLPMKSLTTFKHRVAQTHLTGHWMYWYFLTNSRGGSRFEDSLNSSFYGSIGTTTSSSFGGGGGFSGGGGGGAGGGGAGGF